MTNSSRSLAYWKTNHSLVVGFGIALNLCVAIPLLLWPACVMQLLGLPDDDLLWPRYAGGLLIILSVFYGPMILDLDRFRIFAWFHIFPARSLGTLFFLGAVVLFGAPGGLLIGALIDGAITILALFCLIRIVGLEQDIATGRADT